MPESTSPILISHLAPRNFLSFGPDNAGIGLKALNLFIGPNGSGKSNLIEAMSFMRAAPREFAEVTRKGGGVAEWLWKGGAKKVASVECVMSNPQHQVPLRHMVAFRAEGQRFSLEDERVEDAEGISGEKALSYYDGYKEGEPTVSYLIGEGDERRRAEAAIRHHDRSIVGQLLDPARFPELGLLAQNYERVRIYREWAFGRNTIFREPQQADMRRHVLEEDFSNLGLFLGRLKTEFPAAKRAILKALQDLYEGISDFEVNTSGGTVQVFLHEGDFAIPATRLSDGTLRYLCLLAILCDPEPPPLICIEEPELGLHPDILPSLADLLKAASERTQIIVTTHSDILVDAMTETPECVVVCEKHEGKTEMSRLSEAELAVWLKKYRLGELWIDGQLGGKRW
jgi:predicted ATPase